MIMLFVISTIFTLVFMTNIDDEVVPLTYRRRLMFPLYFGFTYIIASLSDNSMGMVMMAYVPAVIAIVFADWKTALVVVIAKPLINSMYLYTRYEHLELASLWVSVLISWGALLILIAAFYHFGHSRVFYIMVGLGLGILEDMQAFFYPTDFSGAHIAFVVNVVSYLIILWFAIGLKDRLRNYEQSITDQLYRDPLTNAYNLKAFNEGKTNNPDSNPYVIGVVDVDKFKSLNDTLGHSAGNTIIQMMAHTLEETMDKHFPDQETDKKAYRVFRFGGEELVCVVQNRGSVCRLSGELTTLFNQLNEDLMSEMQREYKTSVTFSAGLSSSIWNDLDADETFKKADRLLYQAKRLGGQKIAADEHVLTCEKCNDIGMTVID